MTKKRTIFSRSVAKMRIERIKDVMYLQPMTARELAEAVFITPAHARAYINFFYQRNMMHIHRYKRNLHDTHKRYVAVYAWGKGEDAEKPKKLTDAERSRLRRMNPKYLEWEHGRQKEKRDSLKRQAANAPMKEAA